MAPSAKLLFVAHNFLRIWTMKTNPRTVHRYGELYKPRHSLFSSPTTPYQMGFHGGSSLQLGAAPTHSIPTLESFGVMTLQYHEGR